MKKIEIIFNDPRAEGLGGVYQVPATNYTVSGQQITFGSAPPANDGATNGHVITIMHGIHKLGE